MSFVHQCLLETKAPIPFPAAGLTIEQPSIRDIAMIGGDSALMIGVEALTKNYKKMVDELVSSDISNFDILMRTIKSPDEQSKFIFDAVIRVLSLLFPNTQVFFTPISMIIKSEDNEQHMIDRDSFDAFSGIIYDMFCVAELHGDQIDDYNPAGPRAAALAEKFRKKRELLAKLRKERGDDDENISLFGKYISILSVGLKISKNELATYSVYQLIEEFKRFQLKEGFDYTFQAKMAGATNIKNAKDWMETIQMGKLEKDELELEN